MKEKVDPTNPGLIYETKAVPDDELNVEPLGLTMTETFGMNTLTEAGDVTMSFVDDLFFGLGIHKLHDDVPDIDFGSNEAACFDLRAFFHHETITIYDRMNKKHPIEGYEKITLEHGDRALIPTGMILDIPPGYSVRLHPRSGNAIKHGITLANAEGVIDSDYTHQLYVALHNTSSVDFTIEHGDRIAQAELVPVMRFDHRYIKEAPGQKGNRTGGFGSTGKS